MIRSELPRGHSPEVTWVGNALPSPVGPRPWPGFVRSRALIRSDGEDSLHPAHRAHRFRHSAITENWRSRSLFDNILFESQT